ncbi:hypothetical protein PG994_012798 [Apiospora phragmitis]|uniref:FAD dependent oxidoreductase domain-containing protein n=1 Tax=Apiospora phragmitis TaxID=2905665 RepID=A0ABR1TBG5_9PEZI
MASTRPFPSAKATTSYWRSSTHPIDTHRSTQDLPEHADVVIISAGYCGTSIAHHLLTESARQGRRAPSIAILDARQACSGATGRNGASFHVLRHPKSLSLMNAATSSLIRTCGRRECLRRTAKKLLSMWHPSRLARSRKSSAIDCDFEETMVSDVCFDDAGSSNTGQALSKAVAAGISTAQPIERSTGTEAERISGVRGAKSCLKYKAARLWPYRLVCQMLETCVSRGANLQTMTPVTSVQSRDDGPGWEVTTSRGSMTASEVVHATNGYSAGLLPELRNRIVPVPGICAHLKGEGPQPPILDSNMMKSNDFEYDYLVPRPDRSIVVGGGRRDYFENLEAWFNVDDDGTLIEPARHYFDGYMQRHFFGWEDTDVRLDRHHGVLLGRLSYVGEVPTRPWSYICAGFTGHGMPQIFHSAKHMALLLLDGKVEKEHAVPIPYQTDSARWNSTQEHSSLSLWRSVTEGSRVRSKI